MICFLSFPATVSVKQTVQENTPDPKALVGTIVSPGGWKWSGESDATQYGPPGNGGEPRPLGGV
jgi:hypothetical protein